MSRPRRSQSNLARRLAYLCRVDLGEAALLASGAKYRRVLVGYLAGLSVIERSLALAMSSASSDVDKAKAIFDWLWHMKPRRFLSRGSFRLTDVVDAQIGEADAVGNCLGLTLLYNSLGQRLGIALKAVHLENAFDRGPHVLSMLPTPEGAVDIENVFAHGFDYRSHRANSGRVEWDNGDLIAELLSAVGNEEFEAGNLGKALRSYEAALYLSPSNKTAELNRLIVSSELVRVVG